MAVNMQSDTLRNVLLAIISVSGLIKVSIDSFSKRAQRRREEKKAKRELEVAEALTERDRKKAEFDQAVAKKVQEVATAAQSVKRDLATNTETTSKAISEVKEELRATHGQVDKVHTIVNSEKTAGMEELKSSRLLTLTALKALLTTNPQNKDMMQAVSVAQTLYDKISKDTADKLSADDQTKRS
jgi:hypothetical protein